MQPKVHGQTPTLALLYRLCIEAGVLTRSQIAPNTFRRIVRQNELLKPNADCSNTIRLAFAKAVPVSPTRRCSHVWRQKPSNCSSWINSTAPALATTPSPPKPWR